MMMTMMMESPVGITYELRSHSLLPVGPWMTDKADSCGELSTAVITGKASCICGLSCGDGLTCRTFPSAALLYRSDNTNFLKGYQVAQRKPTVKHATSLRLRRTGVLYALLRSLGFRITASICGGICTSRLYFVNVRVRCRRKTVHVRYLISWWVSCYI